MCILAGMNIVLRIFRNLIIGAIALIFVLLGYLFATEPVMTKRLLTMPFGGGTGPVEVVHGNERDDIPRASLAQLSTEVLDDAVAYGATTDSHALLIYHNDGLALEHYFPGSDANTLTPTQSMHKSVVALLVGIAIDQGYIGSVDDPASLYLTEWAGDDRAGITIKQMLRQTSGIKFSSTGLKTIIGFLRMMLGPDVTAETLPLPLEVEPGIRFDYNTAIPQNIGLIIERATGMRYAEYLSTALWQRIGTPDAFVHLDSVEKGMARTGCCLDATARSWLKIGLLHLDAGRLNDRQIVPEQWIREITVPGKHNPNYGYFTWLGTKHEPIRLYNRKSSTGVIHSEPFIVPDVIYFDGFGGQRVYIIPSNRLVIVRTGAIATDWDDAYLPNLLVRGLQQS